MSGGYGYRYGGGYGMTDRPTAAGLVEVQEIIVSHTAAL